MDEKHDTANATAAVAAPKSPGFVRRSLSACLLNTTLRGPRRIVTSEVRFLSYFWTAVCIGSLLLLIAHFYQLVQAYLAYQTYMLQTEVLHDNGTLYSTEFPDIVICPHQLFSKSATELWESGSVKSPWLQIRDYASMVEANKGMLYNMSESDLRIVLDAFNYPATLGYYLNNLTDDEVLKLGRGNEVLIDCAVSSNGRRRARHNCPIKLNRIIFRKYLVCLQVTVDPSVSSNTNEVSLFLDSGPRWETFGPEFMRHMVSFMQDYEQLGRGFTLWLKQTGRPFDSLSKRVFLQPGRVSRVTFQERIEFKRQGPYPGTCNSNSDYSQPQCTTRQFVHHVQQLCSCNYFEDSTYWHKGLPHCSEMLPSFEKSLEQIRCVDRAEQNLSLVQKLETCPVPCRRHLYNMDVSSSDFDLPSWFLCWLQQPVMKDENVTVPIHICLQNTSSCHEYATRVIKFIKSSHHNLSAVKEMMANCNMSLFAHVPIGQVASVVLYRSSEAPSMLRQQYIVTPALLFSQIGGASSLYLGLSLTFFAEIFDWLARLAIFFWAKHGPGKKEQGNEGGDNGECRMKMIMSDQPGETAS